MKNYSPVQLNAAMSLLLLLIMVAVTSLNGCSTAPAPTITTNVELSGTINEAGSTSVQPLAELMAAAFNAKYPKVTINISGGGSSAGVKAAAAGTVDIGAASRDLSMTEADLIPFCIARDGVAIAVSANNPVTKLTTEQVAKIYSGDISNWKDVGGNDATIIVVSREEGSGTRECFETYVTKPYGKKIKAEALFFDSNGAVRTKVNSERNAIGYISFGYIEGLKGILINEVAPTIENGQNGKYPIVRRLYFLTKPIPTGIVKAYIDFCRGSEGQSIAKKEGYIPLVDK
jgi:phosphate transport system substrate-binding protein